MFFFWGTTGKNSKIDITQGAAYELSLVLRKQKERDYIRTSNTSISISCIPVATFQSCSKLRHIDFSNSLSCAKSWGSLSVAFRWNQRGMACVCTESNVFMLLDKRFSRKCFGGVPDVFIYCFFNNSFLSLKYS